MLQRLMEYANEQDDNPMPPLYEMTPVAHIIILNHDGHPLSPQPIAAGIDSSTARGRRGLEIAAPEINRSGTNPKPLLLAEKSEYAFGVAQDAKDQNRASRVHQGYLDLLRRCSEATQEPSVRAVQKFYELGGIELLELEEKWDHGLKVTFEVMTQDGTRQRPIDLPSVQRFWLQENLPKQDETEQCLICGERKPVLN